MDNYKLYVGTTSGNYNAAGSPKSMGNVTLGYFDIPDDGATYFFALTAIDTANALQSGFSNEIFNTFVPTKGVGRWLHLIGNH